MNQAAGKMSWLKFFPASGEEWQNWQWQMKNRISSLSQLEGFLGGPAAAGYAKLVALYPLAITPYYLSLAADPGDEADPIRKQCFPDLRELDNFPGCLADPLEEGFNMPVFGLIHRYEDRCLILATRQCATHCRHCNRKRLWPDRRLEITGDQFSAMFHYVAATKQLREVIISGGDPLTLNDESLSSLLSSLRSIAHIEVLRIGSRAPVVMPMRITEKLCAILRKHRPLWLNTQFNHPLEITAESTRACEMLMEAGIPVSNQSVLLKGINDNFRTMRDLLHGLQRAAIRPYYLFQADKVTGTGHFHVAPQVGRGIMDRLWQTTSGLCLPRYVIDMPGRKGKTPLDQPGGGQR